jgi:hypothetical protein
MNIVLNYFNDANAPKGFRACCQAVADFYESVYSDPITINVNVGFGVVGGTGKADTDKLGINDTELRLVRTTWGYTMP